MVCLVYLVLKDNWDRLVLGDHLAPMALMDLKDSKDHQE